MLHPFIYHRCGFPQFADLAIPKRKNDCYDFFIVRSNNGNFMSEGQLSLSFILRKAIFLQNSIVCHFACKVSCQVIGIKVFD